MSTKNSKCSDIDGLQIQPVKYVINIISPILEHIVNCIFAEGVFPKKLQLAKVAVIFKDGDTNSFTNYRPISILPVFSKCVEKLILIRITNFSDKHNLITECQFGFRKGRSTETALLTQKDYILESFETEHYTLGIFVDYSKAFDCVNHKILLEKLGCYGFRGIFKKLIESYFAHRYQQVTINGVSSELRPVNTGVPQGSILGPLLFNFYINDVVNIDVETKFVIYADDMSLFLTGKHLGNLIETGNALLNKLDAWSKANSLTINEKKTKAVLFRAMRKPAEIDVELRLGSKKIEFVRVVKSLGVLLEEHMSWNDQLEAVLNKLSKAVGIMCKFRFFLPQKIKLLLYNSLFLPCLTYSYLVWGTTTKSNIEKLLRIQKKAVRTIVNAAYDAHTEPIFKSLNLLPVTELYHSTLLKRHQLAIKNDDAFIIQLSGLKAKEQVRELRVNERWEIPRVRTNYGYERVHYQLPALLNAIESSCNNV